MQIPFCGPTYLGRSPNIDASRSVNWFPELTGTTDSKTTMNMVATPGLNLFALSIGYTTTPVRGCYTFGSLMYVVIYNKLFSLNSSAVVTTLGTLNTTSGRVDFASNGILADGVGGNQLAIVDGTNLYIYNVLTTAFSVVTGGGLLTNPIQIEYLDGYFITSNGTMTYCVSNLYDGTTWGALAVAAISATSDNIQAVVNHRQQLFFIKQGATEVWYDAGTPTTTGSPFSRVSGAVYDYGIASKWSVGKGGSSFYFLCTQRTSDGGETVGVAEVTEYQPVIISPPNINYKLSTSTTHANCFGYCYSEQGHMFYVLTNPDDNWTIVYDASTKMWHERSSLMVDTVTTPRHLSNCYTFFNNKHYVGDYRNGNIYEMSTAFNTDNGNQLWSFRTAQTIFDKDQERDVFISKLIVDAETGFGTNTPQVIAVAPFVAGWAGNVGAVDKGTYNAATPYNLYEIVTYSTVQYYCIQAGTGQQPDTHPLFWQTPIPKVLILADGNITAGARLSSSANPQAYLSWSNDNGHTWSAEQAVSMGIQAAYTTRLVWRRLGRARGRVFKLCIRDAVKKNLIGAYVEAGL